MNSTEKALLITFIYVICLIIIASLIFVTEFAGAAHTAIPSNFAENDAARLILVGPTRITVQPREEVTRRYSITVKNKSATNYLYAEINSPELELYDYPVFIEPLGEETVRGWLTVSEWDEGELTVTAAIKRLKVELPVLVVVKEDSPVEPAGFPDWPEYMWSDRFYELLDNYEFGEAVEIWKSEFGK